MILSKTAKRLLIYFFYDKDGIVDRYVPTILADMKKNVTKTLFVSNGTLTDASRASVSPYADEILERENVGFDVWAYKEALEHVGFDALKKDYDELILMNYTIMGPVYPFSEMFEKMDAEDLDFWGLTKYHKVPFDPFGTLECGYIREHLQSHFIAVRTPVLSSDAFEKYWAEMREINSYADSVSYHETRFTHHFASLGFRWRPYVDTTDLEGYTYCPILFAPVKLLTEKRCPVIKRRSFFHDYDETVVSTVGECAYELMRYLKNETTYDTDLIWENILRCYPMADIKNALQLNYILPTEKKAEATVSSARIALVFHAYFMDLLDSTYHYVNMMPAHADIYITAGSESKKTEIEERFKGHKFHKLEVRLIENRGRDVSALLVGVKDVIMDYDYVCFAHDKKVTQLARGSVGAGFAYQCLEGVLANEEYVANIVELFDNNPRLGLITPPPPCHGDYFVTVANGWGPNFDVTKDLAERLELNVPMKEDSYPIAPLGTMFWFRPKGMKKLFDLDWEYTDFPKEPNKPDGTLLHAIERIYNLVEQDAGYYSAYCVPAHLGSILMTNYSYMLAGLVDANKVTGPLFGMYHDFVHRYKMFFTAWSDLQSLKVALPALFGDSNSGGKGMSYASDIMRLYYAQGMAFDEAHSLLVTAKPSGDTYHCTFTIPEDESAINSLRFDPGEAAPLCICKISATWLDTKGKRHKLRKPYFTNGFRRKRKLIFLERDPQLIWSLPQKSKVASVTIDINMTLNAATITQSVFPSQKPGILSRLWRKIR